MFDDLIVCCNDCVCFYYTTTKKTRNKKIHYLYIHVQSIDPLMKRRCTNHIMRSVRGKRDRLKLRLESLKGKSKKRQRQRVYKELKRIEYTIESNYVIASEPGCHVAFRNADWIADVTALKAEDFGIEEKDIEKMLPDISIDPETGLLSVINKSLSSDRTFYLTIVGSGCRLRDGKTGKRKLQIGICWGNDGVKRNAITLVLVVSPKSVMDVAYVSLEDLPDGDVSKIDLVSDIKELKTHPLPKNEWYDKAMKNCVVRFPFPSTTSLSYLCSQGFGGHFTHSFASTCHAIDLECAVGTPIVAVADGTIVDVRQKCKVGGIHVKNLFEWNSILLRLEDSEYYAEYVHVAANSVSVKVGDRVKEGEVICKSGDVGFCPSPHLHFQILKSADDDAPTVPFSFRSSGDDGDPFVPLAGEHYNESGLVVVKEDGDGDDEKKK